MLRTAPNVQAIVEAARVTGARPVPCLLCGHHSRSATTAGVLVLADHHAATEHGGQS